MNNETTNSPNPKDVIKTFLQDVKEFDRIHQETTIRNYAKDFRGNEQSEKRIAFIAALLGVGTSDVKPHSATVAMLETLLVAAFYDASRNIQELKEKVLYSDAEKEAKQLAEQRQGKAITNAFNLIMSNFKKLSLEQLYALLNMSEGTIDEKQTTTKEN